MQSDFAFMPNKLDLIRDIALGTDNACLLYTSSFFCKMEMGSVFLSGDDEIIVIDPMNEYFDIAETYGGTVVNLSLIHI